MALDGLFLSKLLEEIQVIQNCHIDKIYQPSKDELVLLLRKPSFLCRLIICTKSGMTRLHITNQRPENPAEPPMFCMLLRKYLGGAKIESISQDGFERCVRIKTISHNEMGDIIRPELIIELISGSPNMILVDYGGKIIDAVKRSNIESSSRLNQPGAIYELPYKKQKHNIKNLNIDALISDILKFENLTLDKALLENIEGISPLICREVSYICSGNVEFPIKETTGYHKNMLASFLSSLPKKIENAKPILLIDKNGTPFDFTFMPITQYGVGITCSEVKSYSDLLEDFYGSKNERERIKALSSDILKLLSNLSSRINRRMALRQRDKEKCADRENLRIYGELIKANIHKISQGDPSVTVVNYYDENLSEMKIPLNPAISPAANAAKYFKEYKKSHTAEQTLTELIKADRTEIAYIDTVLDSLARADNTADIAEIRQEMMTVGYMHQNKANIRCKSGTANFGEYYSPSGFKVLVGKNNLQNDRLTLHTAAKNDMWFHTKNIPGSHVVVLCGGAPISDDDVMFAAKLAAKNSKASNSAQVPVDYTNIKNIKKPSGAKPGFVIYSTNYTIFVKP